MAISQPVTLGDVQGSKCSDDVMVAMRVLETRALVRGGFKSPSEYQIYGPRECLECSLACHARNQPESFSGGVAKSRLEDTDVKCILRSMNVNVYGHFKSQWGVASLKATGYFTVPI